jgi:hypothetical protein
VVWGGLFHRVLGAGEVKVRVHGVHKVGVNFP